MKGKNAMLAVFSLVIAVLLRLAVTPTEATEIEREFEAPLVQQGLPEGLAIVQAPQSVTMVATGSAAEVDRFETGPVRAEADMSGATAGTGRFAVGVRGGSGTSRVKVRPKSPTVAIEVDRLVARGVDVAVVQSGLANPDFVVDGVTTDPEEVQVVGPERFVRRVKETRATLDLSQLVPGQAIELEPEPLDADGKPVAGIAVRPGTVLVRAALRPAPKTKRVPVSVAYTGQLPPGAVVESVRVVPPQVTLQGPASALSSLASALTQPIDLGTLGSSREVTVNLALPDGVRAVGPEEFTVSVQVRRQALGGRRP
jgi:YbbR domain-containing protein